MDTTVTVRMSKEKRERGNDVFEKLGTNPSKAINGLYDYAIEHGSLPYENENETTGLPLGERLLAAEKLLDGITTLPRGNRFASMTDDEIRSERLHARNLL